MDNLNKENFFNALQQQCPKAMRVFCDWIDAYKVKIDWSKKFAPGIKFHDIPYSMQAGILVEFTREHHPEGKAPFSHNRDEVTEFFKYLLYYILND